MECPQVNQNAQAVTSILFDFYYESSPGPLRRITITRPNGSQTVYRNNQNISNLSFTLGSGGRSIRLPNLPGTLPNDAESGTVYRVPSNIQGSLGDYVIIAKS